MKNSYVVSVPTFSPIFSQPFWFYVKRINSYKNKKAIYTIVLMDAHIYKEEKTATKAAQAFNGKIQIV